MIDFSQLFSRRRFLAGTSCFGAFHALARLIPLPTLAADVAGDTRVSETPLVDKGFASVRKIGDGLYATISDLSKGNTTVCNGGFLVGRDAALRVEGFATPAGASFQMDARSEEHTSELQSHVNLVCRLLLEKKKNKTKT